jgi:hypothetical protein
VRLEANARQIRLMAVWLMPVARAIDRVDQWVSWRGGGSSRVLVITCSTCSSVMVRGRPGRGSSDRPSSRWRTNRPRHLVTVCGQIPSCSATALLVAPSAHASTILARSASACAVLARRAQRCSVCRSSSVRVSGALGRPRSAMPKAYDDYPSNYQLRTLGRTSRVVSPAQHRALAVRDGGCVFPDCGRPLAWCEAHHLWHWLDGGPTDLDNLILLCRAHHRAVHEGGWQLHRQPDGRCTTTPTQRRHRHRHRRPRTAA